MLIAEGPDYRRVTTSKGLAPSPGPKPGRWRHRDGPARSAPQATNDQLQLLVEQLLADGAAQADVDELIALVPTGDATEGLAVDVAVRRSVRQRRREARARPAGSSGAGVSNFLYPIASHWAGSAVACRFKAFADNVPLAATTDTQPTSRDPERCVRGTAGRHAVLRHLLGNGDCADRGGHGALSVKASSAPFVKLRTVVANASRGTVVLIKVSRCKDVTTAATATPNVFER